MSDPRICRACAWALIALFLASIGRLYHPVYGFTGLIAFPAGMGREHPALRAVPHRKYPPGYTYDGQFYAQLALEPLLRDPAIDGALDQPPYRARRILFSWSAHLLGFGRPAWVLTAYALQNVVAWLLLAWLLTRWLPVGSPRTLALWAACLFSHGLLWSVRFSLLDGPSLLLLAWGAALAERGGTWSVGAILGAAGLGRETNVLGAVMLPLPRELRGWVRTLGALALVVLPLLLWQDYLWSIYRHWSFAGGDQIAGPLVGYLKSWRDSFQLITDAGATLAAMSQLLVVVSLTTQLAYLVWSRDIHHPWWRLALVFGVLMLLVDPVVWMGLPGAITRVVLPLTVGFNVLLSRAGRGFWLWYLAGNLHLLLAPVMLRA
ncbi:MAG TPA: hypothetical protein VD833_08275 [Vicinamibacterales bacterium]|nr:hypothetical protein [Vicinamibacterales bacterium]